MKIVSKLNLIFYRGPTLDADTVAQRTSLFPSSPRNPLDRITLVLPNYRMYTKNNAINMSETLQMVSEPAETYGGELRVSMIKN